MAELKNGAGNLDGFSKEELIQIIENLNRQCIVNFDDEKDGSIEYKAIIESALDIVFLIDRNQHIIFLNDAWKTAFPFKEYTKKPLYSDFFYEIDPQRGKFIVDSVFNDRQFFKNELLKISNDGVASYYTTNISPLVSKGGEIIALIGIMRDYSSQYQIQKKLKENTLILEQKVQDQIKQAEELKNLRDFNEEIINNVPIGMFIADPTGIVVSENPMLSKIMVRELNSLVGVNIIRYSGWIQAGFTDLFNQVLITKKPIMVTEKKYSPMSGQKELVVNVTFDPILQRSGNVENVLIMIEDVTDQVQTRKRISRAEKMTALGLLSSGVASELKTHINKMVMDLNFIDSNVDEGSPTAEYVAGLKDELERIKIISEQLLSLSVIDERDKEICEINKIITSMPVDVYLSRFRNKGHIVEISLPEVSPEIFATQNQLQQMLIQFLENSEDALVDRGKITIKVESVTLETMPCVIITIGDTGMGIPESNINKVFQPFFSTKGKKGTGLGMMIATNIISNLGGMIGIKSRPGEGTSIRVLLPQLNK